MLLEDLLIEVQTKLSMASGLDVQTYGQPRIVSAIQSCFDTFFDKVFWDQYLTYEDFTLDGTTGIVTADLTTKIKRFVDIMYVWPQSYRSPLAKLKKDTNPAITRTPVYAPYNNAAKRFKVYPITTTGVITVAYRTKPARFTFGDDIDIDEELAIAGACVEYLSMEATNPVGMNRFEQAYNKRLEHLLYLEKNPEKSLYADTTPGIMDWRDS